MLACYNEVSIIAFVRSLVYQPNKLTFAAPNSWTFLLVTTDQLVLNINTGKFLETKYPEHNNQFNIRWTLLQWTSPVAVEMWLYKNYRWHTSFIFVILTVKIIVFYLILDLKWSFVRTTSHLQVSFRQPAYLHRDLFCFLYLYFLYLLTGPLRAKHLVGNWKGSGLAIIVYLGAHSMKKSMKEVVQCL